MKNEYNDLIKVQSGDVSREAYEDYMVSLFENKDRSGLTCDDIATLLNRSRGVNFGESTYRKYFSAFNAGRMYERRKHDENIFNRILAISDLHVPFQLPVETYKNYIGKVDTLIINGDISDCQALSIFPKAYRQSVIEELIIARNYLIDLILYISPTKAIINYGNHDHRLQKYLMNKLDSDVLELMPRTTLDLIVVDGFTHYNKREKTKTHYEPLYDVFADDKVEIIYTDDWKVKEGKAWFAHPSAYSSGSLKTANRAMDYFNQIDDEKFDAVVIAHTHQSGYEKKGKTALFEQGCCCDINKLDYQDGKLTNLQDVGFVYLCQGEDGSIIEDKSKLVQVNM